jgi:hypothetical protein
MTMSGQASDDVKAPNGDPLPPYQNQDVICNGIGCTVTIGANDNDSYTKCFIGMNAIAIGYSAKSMDVEEAPEMTKEEQLESKLPNAAYLMNAAMCDGEFAVMTFLYKQINGYMKTDCYIPESCVNTMIETGDQGILSWSHEIGFVLTSRMLLKHPRNLNIRVIMHAYNTMAFDDRAFMLKSSFAELMADHGKIEILKFVRSHGAKFSSRVLENALIGHYFEIAEWIMDELRIVVDDETMSRLCCDDAINDFINRMDAESSEE